MPEEQFARLPAAASALPSLRDHRCLPCTEAQVKETAIEPVERALRQRADPAVSRADLRDAGFSLFATWPGIARPRMCPLATFGGAAPRWQAPRLGAIETTVFDAPSRFARLRSLATSSTR